MPFLCILLLGEWIKKAFFIITQPVAIKQTDNNARMGGLDQEKPVLFKGGCDIMVKSI